jgi:hypothetical protein
LALARAFATQRASCGQLGGTGSFAHLAHPTVIDALMSAIV